MTQWIITGIILLAATVYASIKIYHSLFAKASQKSDCNACSADCSMCPASSVSTKLHKAGMAKTNC